MKIGFIDYYLDEWHANTYPKMIKEQSQGRLEVCYAYGMIPSPISGKTTEEWCEEYGIELCKTIEEVIEKSDALVVLSPDNCEMHETLSQLPLKSGKKTYIDKTFAPSKKTAESIFALAEEYGTPCYSTSALRFADEYQPLKGKNIKAAAFWGPNGVETYSIHQLEPMIMLMQGAIKRVMAVTKENWSQVLLEWEDGRVASMVCTGEESSFLANLSLDTGCKTVEVKSDFFKIFIDNLIRFFETGERPVSHEETIRIMAVREASIKAIEHPGEWINV